MALVCAWLLLLSPAQDLSARSLQSLLAQDPAEVLRAADSLQAAGSLSPARAASLKALALNRPGVPWDEAVLDSLFRVARGLEVYTADDSLWCASVLLSEAYFHARRCGLAKRWECSAQAEADALQRAVAVSVDEALRARALMELGRLMRFISPTYGAPADCTAAARRLLDRALEGAPGDLVPYVLWQKACLDAENGRWADVVRVAQDLARRCAGTKWEPRAHGLEALATGKDLALGGFQIRDDSLLVWGWSRNLDGTLRATLARIQPSWVDARGRLPFSSERPRLLPRARGSTRLAPQAQTWCLSLPLPGSGFYRCVLSCADTTVAVNVGILDACIQRVDSLCFSNASPDTLTVHTQSARGLRLAPGQRCCAPWALIYDERHAAWWGDRRQSKAWMVGGHL